MSLDADPPAHFMRLARWPYTEALLAMTAGADLDRDPGMVSRPLCTVKPLPQPTPCQLCSLSEMRLTWQRLPDPAGD